MVLQTRIRLTKVEAPTTDALRRLIFAVTMQAASVRCDIGEQDLGRANETLSPLSAVVWPATTRKRCDRAIGDFDLTTREHFRWLQPFGRQRACWLTVAHGDQRSQAASDTMRLVHLVAIKVTLEEWQHNGPTGSTRVAAGQAADSYRCQSGYLGTF